jgi:recombinational DNA repair protein RecR
VGPEALRLDELKRRVAEEGVREIILATNPSMEGEVTATYIQQTAGRLRGASPPGWRGACRSAETWSMSTG